MFLNISTGLCNNLMFGLSEKRECVREGDCGHKWRRRLEEKERRRETERQRQKENERERKRERKREKEREREKALKSGTVFVRPTRPLPDFGGTSGRNFPKKYRSATARADK